MCMEYQSSVDSLGLFAQIVGNKTQNTPCIVFDFVYVRSFVSALVNQCVSSF